MAEKRPAFESELEWQINARARIQELMYRLYHFLERYSEFPNEKAGPDDYWSRMAWMVDAAFSLWRSAFLTDASRERKVVYEHTKEFLKKVLEHNAITFADDHRLRALAVGYYNANARYRLERLLTGFPALLEEFTSVQEVAKLRGNDLAKEDQARLWDIYFHALDDTFNWFKAEWVKNMRPGDAEAIATAIPDASAGDGSTA